MAVKPYDDVALPAICWAVTLLVTVPGTLVSVKVLPVVVIVDDAGDAPFIHPFGCGPNVQLVPVTPGIFPGLDMVKVWVEAWLQVMLKLVGLSEGHALNVTDDVNGLPDGEPPTRMVPVTLEGNTLLLLVNVM